MIIEMGKRKYTLKKRAASQDETRARIVEATIALHEEIGPRNTTISAVAERAGVQRLTVYRHFPNEMALFEACTSGWLAAHPPPAIGGPHEAGALGALASLYAYYRGTQRMWTVAYRDADVVPALQGPMHQVAEYLSAYAHDLLSTWPERKRTKALRAAATLSVQFATWQTLAAAGLPDRDMARLMESWLCTAGGPRPSRPQGT